jgi:type IV pilus assembly protein PilV
MAATRKSNVARTQSGFSMIEILVSMFIIATGLFGLIGMQILAHKSELDSYQRAQALVLITDIIDRVNLNRKVATCYAITTTSSTGTPYLGTTTGGGHYDTTGFSCPTMAANPNAVARASQDLVEMDSMLQGSAEALSGGQVGAMIGARACIGFDSATQRYIVAVAWQGSSEGFDPTGWAQAPDVAKNCAKGLYGTTEGWRRVVWNTLLVASLT